MRNLSFHHLIPRKLHRRAGFKKRYTAEELDRGIYLCQHCHKGLHRLYDEMTLAKQFGDIALIRQDEAISRHVEWSAKQKVR